MWKTSWCYNQFLKHVMLLSTCKFDWTGKLVKCILAITETSLQLPIILCDDWHSQNVKLIKILLSSSTNVISIQSGVLTFHKYAYLRYLSSEKLVFFCPLRQRCNQSEDYWFRRMTRHHQLKSCKYFWNFFYDCLWYDFMFSLFFFHLTGIVMFPSPTGAHK